MITHKFTLGYLYLDQIPPQLQVPIKDFFCGPGSAGSSGEHESFVPSNFHDILSELEEPLSPDVEYYLGLLVADAQRQGIDEVCLVPGSPPASTPVNPPKPGD
jgi:hypothetical protein